MDVMTALLTRPAPARLSGPAPGDGELRYLLKGAAAACGEGPHPWHWILDSTGDTPGGGAAAGGPLRAVLVLVPARAPHLSDGERTRRVYTALNALELLLHARGYASSWQPADLATRTASARSLPELGSGESLLGLLTIGRPDSPQALVRRPLADIADLVSRRAAPVAGAAAR
ncbi:nitroreductase [Streptomyces sp. NPDC101225]|uniref:nitroreductase n=1 Tax=Streptomyces sp. NPDC101225 TaxID=3366135 RepID=UPI0038200039